MNPPFVRKSTSIDSAREWLKQHGVPNEIADAARLSMADMAYAQNAAKLQDVLVGVNPNVAQSIFDIITASLRREKRRQILALNCISFCAAAGVLTTIVIAYSEYLIGSARLGCAMFIAPLTICFASTMILLWWSGYAVIDYRRSARMVDRKERFCAAFWLIFLAICGLSVLIWWQLDSIHLTVRQTIGRQPVGKPSATTYVEGYFAPNDIAGCGCLQISLSAQVPNNLTTSCGRFSGFMEPLPGFGHVDCVVRCRHVEIACLPFRLRASMDDSPIMDDEKAPIVPTDGLLRSLIVAWVVSVAAVVFTWLINCRPRLLFDST